MARLIFDAYVCVCFFFLLLFIPLNSPFFLCLAIAHSFSFSQVFHVLLEFFFLFAAHTGSFSRSLSLVTLGQFHSLAVGSIFHLFMDAIPRSLSHFMRFEDNFHTQTGHDNIEHSFTSVKAIRHNFN